MKGWRSSEAVKKVAQEEFKTVMSEQFNEIYGLDPDDIKAWQYMLQVLRVDPIPSDLMDCKRVRYTCHRSRQRCTDLRDGTHRSYGLYMSIL